MSAIDRSSNSDQWTLGKDLTIQAPKKTNFLSKTKIEATCNGNKVTGETFLVRIIKEISKNPDLSEKLKNLEKGESVKLIFAGSNEFVLTKASSRASKVAKTVTKNCFVVTTNTPPPINRATKPKATSSVKQPLPKPAKKSPVILTKAEQKIDEQETAKMWRTLEETGEVTL